jgi:hypothetical protein
MSTFGDDEPDDAWDPERADPEQVAHRLHELRLGEGLEGSSWEQLSPARRALLILIVARVLDWLRHEGST